MPSYITHVARLAALTLFACTFNACRDASIPSIAPTASPATIAETNAAAADISIRYLEAQIRRNPEDFIAYNKLASYYLQRARETGDANYISLAGRAAHSSLDVLPAEQNAEALAALTRYEITSHDFARARERARELITLKPEKSEPYMLLGDALIELGDYDAAARAYEQMRQFADPNGDAACDARLSHQAFIKGDAKEAQRLLTSALALAERQAAISKEPLAWYHWQLGELEFARGDYKAAEHHYRDALEIFPDYFRALAALGRVRAANNDLPNAINFYEQAVQRFPDPAFVSTLGDLYQLGGRAADARAQYELVIAIARLSQFNNQLYNRQLANFYADHDTHAEEAYTLAAREYETRRDIYGADTLAWAALKAGKITEAQEAIKQALKFDTQDARLFYHAGMIAHAARNSHAAQENLTRALKLNPQFDSLQATIACRALKN